jgi:nucleoid-associated protein YgaU
MAWSVPIVVTPPEEDVVMAAAVVIAPAHPAPARRGPELPSRPPRPTARSSSTAAPRVRRLDERTYWRRRITALLVVVLALAGLVFIGTRAVDQVVSWSARPTLSAPHQVESSGTGSGAPDDVYVVEPGDTLWSIAERLAPDEDPRPIVHRLAERAGGSVLRPGQRLSLAGVR